MTMSVKRPHSPDLIANPFIKKRNLEWTLDTPVDELTQSTGVRSQKHESSSTSQDPTTAAVESGTASVTDHLDFFTSTLKSHIQPSIPVLPISSYSNLYTSNADSAQGAHFVIHQHDHPVAGTHYDLRLQINETSSTSWAIMYGLPGDPNSTRLNRNATETRIHCLWNHLIETASAATGSLLIWDTGTYTILPRRSKHDPLPDPSSPPGSPSDDYPSSGPSQQTLLHQAFQTRKIRLRLHGSRLPDPYVINLRLTKKEDAEGREKSGRTPKTRRRGGRKKQAPPPEETSDEADEEDENEKNLVPKGETADGDSANISAMEREIRELEDEEVRRTNAYTGASNTIGSVHQRKWYLSMDRSACGFFEGSSRAWHLSSSSGKDEEPEEGEKETHLKFPFYVRGADHERSIVTGRRGQDVLRDEGVTDFVQRKGWKPVLN